MGKILVSFLALCLISCSSGLALRFEMGDMLLPGDRSACGVVTCTHSYSAQTSGQNQDDVTANSSSSGISSLKVYTGAVGGRRLLAAVTLQQPSITRVADGVKIEGHLEKHAAQLRLEFFKNKDCSAAFTCELLSRDALGTEILSSNELQQRVPSSPPPKRDGVISPAISTQLMMISQQLSLFENRIEDRIRSVEEKIESKVADKLCQLEARLSTLNNATRLAARDEIGIFQNFLSEQKQHFERALAVSERVERSLNESIEVVYRHLNQIQNLGSANCTSVGASDVSIPTKTCTDKKNNSELALGRKLLEEFRRLELATYNSSTDTLALSSLRDEISQTNALITSDIKPISDLLMPKQCTRGLVSFAVQTPFPYPVIRPNRDSGLDVPYLCDQLTDGGGWIVIQRRSTGQEEFYRDWATYKKGFGSLAGDFWIGNENLYILTNNKTFELRVELKYKGESSYAHYDKFSVASEQNNYALDVGHYDGTAGDSLIQHNTHSFSTFDKDNDKSKSNCARGYTGAWWYHDCHTSNLNGKWGATGYAGPRWDSLTKSEPATFTEMKIRAMDIS
ncbi:hypothetical protein EGW08_009129 [Elysia chlorotica]|uniref:Fibrinogen C-terminal domain-containing protein n=1 Tax=Elysia chlorotica TaxID=188477 RepID=A0A433TND1_ELYCH|nr:hypothetical protein EGW08_009129 [Elysia chlorotica]